MQPTWYARIILLFVTDLLLTVFSGSPLELYGGMVPLPVATVPAKGGRSPPLHDQVLPALFYVLISLHMGDVLKHHFIARRTDDVRRMLR